MSLTFETAILTPAQMARAIELCGIAEAVLIENSGRAVAEEISHLYGACKAVALCGSGSIGEIGRAAAGFLKSWGWPIDVAEHDIGQARLIIDAIHDTGSEFELSQVLADSVTIGQGGHRHGGAQATCYRKC